MCGLYGVIGRRDDVLDETGIELRKRVVSSLAIAMEERGTDSAGIAVINREKPIIVKKAITATEFIKLEDYNKALENKAHIIIGHTRAKTHGAVIDKNAHPFLHGTVVGAHNGVVANYKEVYPDGEVDSEAIFYQLNKDRGNYKRSFSMLRGNMAVTWVDTDNPDAVCLMRHTNPLYLAYFNNIGSYVWASTEEAIKIVSVATMGSLPEVIMELEEDIVYRVRGDLKVKTKPIKLKAIEAAKPVVTPTTVPATEKTHSSHSYSNANTWNYSRTIVRQQHQKYLHGWGDTDFFNVPVLKLERRIGLLAGCNVCEKVIERTVGFYFDPDKNVAVHQACVPDYTAQNYKEDQPLTYLLFFGTQMHSAILATINQEDWENFIREEEKKELEKIDPTAIPDIIGLSTMQENVVQIHQL